jgi:hypothetical protein
VNLDDLGGGGSNRLGSLVAGDLINRGGLGLSSLLGSDGLLGRLRSRGRVGDDYITVSIYSIVKNSDVYPYE